MYATYLSISICKYVAKKSDKHTYICVSDKIKSNVISINFYLITYFIEITKFYINSEDSSYNYHTENYCPSIPPCSP